jgi:hypothetical protein
MWHFPSETDMAQGWKSVQSVSSVFTISNARGGSLKVPSVWPPRSQQTRPQFSRRGGIPPWSTSLSFSPNASSSRQLTYTNYRFDVKTSLLEVPLHLRTPHREVKARSVGKELTCLEGGLAGLQPASLRVFRLSRHPSCSGVPRDSGFYLKNIPFGRWQ